MEEVVHADQASLEQGILTAADERDQRADARDEVADRRDTTLNLESWLHHDDDDAEADAARRLAADDRKHSRDDRTLSASDRRDLARGTPEAPRAADD
jgi:hypothetical protein